MCTELISTLPLSTKSRTVRPKSPPTASPTSGIPRPLSTCRDATTFRSPIWIVPGGASDANMLAPPARRAVMRRGLAPSFAMSSSSAGTASLGELGRVRVRPAQRRRRQQDVRQPADRGHGVVEHDRDAAPEAHGHQHVGFPADLQVGHPHEHFVRLHAGLR